MDVVEWAQVVSPLVSLAGIAAVVRWGVLDRRRADALALEDRLRAEQRAEEDRFRAQRVAANAAEAELVLRVGLSFERHQAGDPAAAAECRALLLAVRNRLPVTRLFYLGAAGWQPADNPRIEALAGYYGLPVGADLARREIRHELQGTQFTLYGREDGTANGTTPQVEGPNGYIALPEHRRQLLLKVRRAGKHAKKAAARQD